MTSLIRIQLIVAGVLPATDDYQELHHHFVSMYPKNLAIGYVYHEYDRTQVIYNKKFKHLVKKCQKYADNQKAFGRLMGYTSLINLRKMDHSKDVIAVNYSLDNTKFIGFWKPMNETILKEYRLLQKMKKINPWITLNFRVASP